MRRRLEQRRYRKNCKAGVKLALTPVNADVMDMLVRLNWCNEGDLEDPKAMGAAIAALLAAAARH
jgi:hypothetical protein